MLKVKKDNLLILGLTDNNMSDLPNRPIYFNMKDTGFQDYGFGIIVGRKFIEEVYEAVEFSIQEAGLTIYKMNTGIVVELYDKDVQHLLSGKPIEFNLGKLNIGDIDVVMYNGRTEESMYMALRDGITPSTKIKGNILPNRSN